MQTPKWKLTEGHGVDEFEFDDDHHILGLTPKAKGTVQSAKSNGIEKKSPTPPKKRSVATGNLRVKKTEKNSSRSKNVILPPGTTNSSKQQSPSTPKNLKTSRAPTTKQSKTLSAAKKSSIKVQKKTPTKSTSRSPSKKGAAVGVLSPEKARLARLQKLLG